MAKIKILGQNMTLVITKDPFYKVPFYVRKPVKWDDRVEGIRGLSRAQALAVKNAIEVFHATRGIRPRAVRLERIRSMLAGKDYTQEAYGISREQAEELRRQARLVPEDVIQSEKAFLEKITNKPAYLMVVRR